MSIEQHAEAAVREYWDAANKADGTGKAMTHYIAKHVTAAIDEATAPLRTRIDLLTAEIARMEAEVKYANGERIRVQDAIHKIDRDIIQTLGKALHYPWFKDDQKTFPGATEADGVAVGDHVAETLAVEAAKRIENLEGLGPLIEEYGDASEAYGHSRSSQWVRTREEKEIIGRSVGDTLAKIDAILKGGAS